ncbi:hypothetical protein TBLA_0B09060 [Henningerozyma blattae CBS 6284]|uniref:Transcription activator GCR1-like domain-containing protein n=1 Tax=Henningerozyma blattae (strain ATCC 34711 / CBS 6284 / DSM 70876 / NBRC 10599 / NRRL Y-10934 / UCD 77-7) TaxID=1071380 RepID=I2H019_HENB6|nr:hypothetical protein TBLA_0B09060 [Tetrapisispora blattae CBS 6284]CCH59721.1 hypothetical protein TBLA_0B09060 [Tetrapisispora blattae CBS 6284]
MNEGSTASHSTPIDSPENNTNNKSSNGNNTPLTTTTLGKSSVLENISGASRKTGSNTIEKNRTDEILKLLASIQDQNSNLKVGIEHLQRHCEEEYLHDFIKIKKRHDTLSKWNKSIKNMTYILQEIQSITNEGTNVVPTLRNTARSISLQNVHIDEFSLFSHNVINHDSSRRDETERLKDIDRTEIILNKRVKLEDEEDFDINNPNYQRDRDFKLAKINISVCTVYEVAKEYYQGFAGRPSLMYMEYKYGPTWRRDPNWTRKFRQRKIIIDKIEDVKKNPTKYGLRPNITREQAIRAVASVESYERCTLPKLVQYFKEKKINLPIIFYRDILELYQK